MRQVVQAVVSMAELAPPEPGTNRDEPGMREPLGRGSHPEVELRASSIGWVGRADLLSIRDTASGCGITDYKTGARSDHHAEQLRVYALLWYLDAVLNPDQTLAEDLTIRYPDGQVQVSPPTRADLATMRDRLTERTAAALDQMNERPPRARPSPRDVSLLPG
jgi:PD-(D/E)XK nuclease superfamily